MKKSKVVIPALGLIALSTAASITGTVAWFSANQSVTVSGMTFKTQVKSNLLISPDHQLANYATSLTQSKSALLLPVSSNNGIGFWYTSASNVDGSGDAKTDTYVTPNYNE